MTMGDGGKRILHDQTYCREIAADAHGSAGDVYD